MKRMPSKYRGFTLFWILATASLLGACGGGGSPSAAGVKTGRFLDSAVEGLGYLSGTQSGLTDANGTFQADETTIQFSIGDIVLGEGIVKPTMTPLDLVSGAKDENDPTVTNITRVLLALDDNDDPGNGIQITAAVREAALGKSIDFSQTPASFENDPNVLSTLSALTSLRSSGERGLYPTSLAQAHLRNTLLGIESFSLTILLSGKEGGSVTSSPEGIDCGLNCTRIYPNGTVVTLTPNPITGSIASAWSGDPDCLDGSVTMTGNRTCRLAFQIPAGKIASGDAHSCQVLADGSIQCWGLNHRGQLGDGTLLSSSIPVRVTGIQTAIAVSAGGGFSCALLSDGRVKCWGLNDQAQLGNDSRLSSSIPVPVSGVLGATAISSGQAHTCALLSDGSIQCWGLNLGRLGNGILNAFSGPVNVLHIQTATAVSSGATQTCALLSDGRVQCWGISGGHLGNNSLHGSSTPVSVIGIQTATAISSGGGHSCALLSDGSVQCWGENADGQLGNGSISPFSLIPTSVQNLKTAIAISAGTNHSCALLSDGTVHCWGAYDPQTPQSSLLPQQLTNILSAAGIASGGDHSCAIFFSGQFECWGKNDQGQLGQ